jgi:dTDP-4-amino-4,6-dideoxygalactose transaminase
VSYQSTVDFIRAHFNTKEFIPLHAPVFPGREKEYLNECIDSTFVSYVGRFVGTFEEQTAAFTGAKYAVACVNGTAALHIALVLAGVKEGDEVISPALTFVATVLIR